MDFFSPYKNLVIKRKGAKNPLKERHGARGRRGLTRLMWTIIRLEYIFKILPIIVW